MAVLTDYQAEQEIRVLEAAQCDEMATALKMKEWGRWKREGGRSSGLGYGGCTIDFSGDPWTEKDLREIVGDISDEQAIRIDKAVKALPDKHHNIIVQIYVRQTTVDRLRRVLRISERHISYFHHQALGMLWAMLRKN